MAVGRAPAASWPVADRRRREPAAQETMHTQPSEDPEAEAVTHGATFGAGGAGPTSAGRSAPGRTAADRWLEMGEAVAALGRHARLRRVLACLLELRLAATEAMVAPLAAGRAAAAAAAALAVLARWSRAQSRPATLGGAITGGKGGAGGATTQSTNGGGGGGGGGAAGLLTQQTVDQLTINQQVVGGAGGAGGASTGQSLLAYGGGGGGGGDGIVFAGSATGIVINSTVTGGNGGAGGIASGAASTFMVVVAEAELASCSRPVVR